MKVILVRDIESGHGILCVAATYEAAIKFLVKNHWIDESIDICDDHNYSYEITDVFGENWVEQIQKLSIEEFNKWFDHWFRLEFYEILT